MIREWEDEIIIKNEKFILLPQKAVIWKRKKILIISDIHLGKISHFRKAGIPLPTSGQHADIQRLNDLVHQVNPRSVIFTGDLFHSDLNNEWFEFTSWLRLHPKIKFHLVKGNHDIIPEHEYTLSNLVVYPEKLEIDQFSFIHHPTESPAENRFYFAGHLHPGITLRSRGRQSITLPCYWITEHQCILPAFGTFTGFFKIKPGKKDRIYVAGADKIFAIAD